MDANPISNFLLNTKIAMKLGEARYVINITHLTPNEIDEIEKLPHEYKKLDDMIEHLANVYMNKITQTDMYKKILLFVSNEEVLITTIYNEIKMKLDGFKYLILYHKQILKKKNYIIKGV